MLTAQCFIAEAVNATTFNYADFNSTCVYFMCADSECPVLDLFGSWDQTPGNVQQLPGNPVKRHLFSIAKFVSRGTTVLGNF